MVVPTSIFSAIFRWFVLVFSITLVYVYQVFTSSHITETDKNILWVFGAAILYLPIAVAITLVLRDLQLDLSKKATGFSVAFGGISLGFIFALTLAIAMRTTFSMNGDPLSKGILEAIAFTPVAYLFLEATYVKIKLNHK